MIGEDKLTRPERVRLESFAQACQSFVMTGHPGRPPTLDDVMARAEQIEEWLAKANKVLQ